MKANFVTAYQLALVHEGGYVNHPDDPGGATNKGITQRTYDAWRRAEKLPKRSVREITDEAIGDIYRTRYWDAVRGDDLPAGVDYAVYDFGVNSGPKRAIQYLQRAVGVSADGKIGPLTMAAVRRADAVGVVQRLCDSRLAYLKRLKHWPTFGRGWERRVSEVKRDALLMVRGTTLLAPGPKPEQNVRTYQRQLKDLGYYDGAIDGIRGPLTIAAIKALQRDEGLVMDGIVGPRTRAVLASLLAPSQPDDPGVPPPPAKPPEGGFSVSAGVGLAVVIGIAGFIALKIAGVF